MPDLSTFSGLVLLDHGLCVCSTLRSDGSIQASVVNAGVCSRTRSPAPTSSGWWRPATRPSSATSGPTPRCTIVARAGWQWAAVEGTADSNPS